MSELLIVVAGVLIALAADGWAETRDERLLEEQYVRGLMTDLQADTAQIHDAIRLAERRAQSVHRLIAEIDGGHLLGSDALANAVEESMWFTFPAYSRTTISDLMSTGNLRLIDDANLKRRVSEYYQRVDRLDQWSGNWRKIQMDLEALIPELLPLSHREVITARLNSSAAPPWSVELEVSTEDAAGIRQRLRTHPEYRTRLEGMGRIHGTLYTHLQLIADSALTALRAAEESALRFGA